MYSIFVFQVRIGRVFGARCSSTLTLFRKVDCVLRSFFKTDAIISSNISESGKLRCPVIDRDLKFVNLPTSTSLILNIVTWRSAVRKQTSVLKLSHSTSSLGLKWLSRRTHWFPFHFSPCCLRNIRSQSLGGRCLIPWIVEDCKG